MINKKIKKIIPKPSSLSLINNNLKPIIKNIKYSCYLYNNKKLFYKNYLNLKKPNNNIYNKKKFSEKCFIKKSTSDGISYIVIVRTTGKFNINPKIKKILQILQIQSPNNTVVLKKNKAITSLLQKVNNHIVWGEISKFVLFKLIIKKKKNINIKNIKKISKNILYSNNKNQINNKKYTKLISYIMVNKFRLNFKLNSSSIHFKRKNNGKNSNTYTGYIGKTINKILNKML